MSNIANLQLAEEMDRIRVRLLDMTARNRLLNFRPQTASIHVIDELPRAVFKMLVNDEKQLVFKPIPDIDIPDTDGELPDVQDAGKSSKQLLVESAQKAGIDTNIILPEDYGLANSYKRKHADRYLQTNMFMKELETKLRRIKTTAKTTIEETGQNQLFLVIGFLKWAEQDKPQQYYEAPLILIPIEIEAGKLDRKSGRYEYEIKYTGEDLLYNVSLAEKLKRDFRLILPNFDDETLKEDAEDYNSLDPEKYFQAVTGVIENIKGWAVLRKIVLGFFSFSKLLMYKDLDTHNPSNAAILNNPIIRQILLGEKTMGSVSTSGFDESDVLEEQVLNTPLVVNADSSQSKAILKAISGANMVIQGPPGTGKSQTITNLIACMINHGKSVLFVAEKMAALEVVKKNLEKVQLDDFCLELHSQKSNKTGIIDSLRKRASCRYRTNGDMANHCKTLSEAKEPLSQYINLLHKIVHPISKTVFDILWKADHLRTIFNQSFFEIKNCENLDDRHLNEYKLTLCQAIDYQEYIFSSEFCWKGYCPAKLYYGDDKNLRQALVDRATVIDEVVSRTEQLCSSTSITLAGKEMSITQWTSFQAFCTQQWNINHELLTNLLNSYNHGLDTLQQFLSDVKIYHANMPTCKLMLNVDLISSPIHELTDSFFQTVSALTIKQAKVIRHSISKALDFHDRIKSLLDIIHKSRLLKISSLSELNAFLRLASAFQTLGIDPNDPQNSGLFTSRFIEVAKKIIIEHKRLAEKQGRLSEIFAVKDAPQPDRIEYIRKILRQKQASFWRFLNKDYRKAIAQLKVFLVDHSAIRKSSLLEQLEQLQSYKTDHGAFLAHNESNKPLGQLFQGEKTDWNWVEQYINWQNRVSKISKSDLAIQRFASLIYKDIPDLQEFCLEVDSHGDSINAIKELFRACGFDIESQLIGKNLSEQFDYLAILGGKLSRLIEAVSPLSKDENVVLKELSDHVDLYCRLKQLQSDMETSNYLSCMIGLGYHDVSTDIVQVQSTLNCYMMIKSIQPSPIFPILNESEQGKAMFEKLKEFGCSLSDCLQKICQTNDSLARYGTVNENELWGKYLPQLTLFALKSRLEELINNVGLLPQWADYHRWLMDMADKMLIPFLNLAQRKIIELQQMPLAYECAFYNSLSQYLLKSEKMLGQFSKFKHEQIRDQFVELDIEGQKSVRKMIACNVGKAIPPQGDSGRRVSELTEMNLLEREFAKNRRHIPIRQLLGRAGKAIRALKPVFMMSPLSVAQFLESGQHNFDVVIMDEASQILPQDALGAIARAKQLIVVGDSKQLPPTTFFMSEFDENEDEDKGLSDDMNSVLELCESSGFAKSRLKWHYRSLHESLIAFSNSQWYDNELILFPSSYGTNVQMGVKFCHIPGAKYSKGKNEKEAYFVAQKIVEHYRSTPHLSLGVGTLNRKQRDIIEDCLVMLKKKDPSIESLLQKAENNAFEPLFIKNLENLQGDERDVIFISCTFGPDSETGTVYQRFGPINSKSGIKRLNVLFTRAKQRMEIFSSMLPDQILGGADASEGANALKRFLTFAKTGTLPELGSASNRQPESDFEISVAKTLIQAGFEVVAQVGVSGYFIDLAVRNPHRKGEYILGIECDGATYHSSIYARDRDRLREEVIRSRGWNLARIWSADWFCNRDKEVSKLIGILKNLTEKERPVVIVQESLPPVQKDFFDSIENTLTDKLTDEQLLSRIKRFFEENEISSNPEGISIGDNRILNTIIDKRITSITEFNQHIPVQLRTELDSEQVSLLQDVFQIVESGS